MFLEVVEHEGLRSLGDMPADRSFKGCASDAMKRCGETAVSDKDLAIVVVFQNGQEGHGRAQDLAKDVDRRLMNGVALWCQGSEVVRLGVLHYRLRAS